MPPVTEENAPKSQSPNWLPPHMERQFIENIVLPYVLAATEQDGIRIETKDDFYNAYCEVSNSKPTKGQFAAWLDVLEIKLTKVTVIDGLDKYRKARPAGASRRGEEVRKSGVLSMDVEPPIRVEIETDDVQETGEEDDFNPVPSFVRNPEDEPEAAGPALAGGGALAIPPHLSHLPPNVAMQFLTEDQLRSLRFRQMLATPTNVVGEVTSYSQQALASLNPQ